MLLSSRSTLLFLTAGCFGFQARAQCDDWTRGFVQPGTNGDIAAVTEWNHGGEKRLVVAGYFTSAGGAPVSHIAYWDGLEFQSVGGGFSGGGARALATFDDGNGPALYVGGQLGHAGSPSIPVADIARWDGTSWSNVGGGVGASSARRVNALLVWDDGTGPALYVGGHFTSAGGVPALNIAKWDGVQWSALGGGTTREVLSLCAFDDGTGAKLYAGCEFAQPSGSNNEHMAVWNGSTWSPMPSPVSHRVRAMVVLDDGTGDALYVGGDFHSAGGMPAEHVAKWNGTSWSALGAGLNANVYALGVHDDGTGRALYAGGNHYFSVSNWGVAKWNGATWQDVGGGMSYGYPAPNVLAFCELDLGVRRVLVAAGLFTKAGGIAAQHVAVWGGGKWRGLGDAPDGYVRALIAHDDGSCIALYAGGSFSAIGGTAARAIARWNGANWSNVTDELGTPVHALTRFDDGTGMKLIAGGSFGQGNVAAWDGVQWSYLAGVSSTVYSFATFDDGAGPKLYCGGDFGMANNQPVTYIAKWNGVKWLPLSGTLDRPVYALCVFDDGAGPALYVGGQVETANGVTVHGIAKWNGSSWSALGSGLGGVFLPYANALAVYDDGSGAALYVGGSFTTAGGSPANYLAKWDGSAWSQVGGGVDGIVTELFVDDDGHGPELVVTGGFNNAGGSPANHLARWNGSNWSTFGGGTNFGALALARFDDGDGVDLYLAGGFTKAGTHTSYNLAIWNRCDGPGTPYCFGDSSGTECVCFNKSSVGSQSGCENSASVGARLYAQGSRSVALDDQTFLATRLPPLKPCILFAGTSATNGGAGLLFDDGLRCAGGAIRRLGLRQSDANGFASWGAGLAAAGGWLAGDVRYFQVWYRDPTGPCMRLSNLSNGYAIPFAP